MTEIKTETLFTLVARAERAEAYLTTIAEILKGEYPDVGLMRRLLDVEFLGEQTDD